VETVPKWFGAGEESGNMFPTTERKTRYSGTLHRALPKLRKRGSDVKSKLTKDDTRIMTFTGSENSGTRY